MPASLLARGCGGDGGPASSPLYKTLLCSHSAPGLERAGTQGPALGLLFRLGPSQPRSAEREGLGAGADPGARRGEGQGCFSLVRQGGIVALPAPRCLCQAGSDAAFLAAGRTIILTTHHLDEAEALSDRVAVLQQGRLRCCGPPLGLTEAYGQGLCLTLTKQVTGAASRGRALTSAAVCSGRCPHAPCAFLCWTAFRPGAGQPAGRGSHHGPDTDLRPTSVSQGPQRAHAELRPPQGRRPSRLQGALPGAGAEPAPPAPGGLRGRRHHPGGGTGAPAACPGPCRSSVTRVGAMGRGLDICVCVYSNSPPSGGTAHTDRGFCSCREVSTFIVRAWAANPGPSVSHAVGTGAGGGSLTEAPFLSLLALFGSGARVPRGPCWAEKPSRNQGPAGAHG